MNNNLKSISIVEIMAYFGYKPVKQNTSTATFLAAWRNDKNPSVSVNINRNTWKDFGSGDGGSNINWLITAQGMSYGEACDWLKQWEGSIIDTPTNIPQTVEPKESSLKIISTRSIEENEACWRYLKNRGIEDGGYPHLHHVTYTNGNDKQFWGIGWYDDSCNHHIKSLDGKKFCSGMDITTILNDRSVSQDDIMDAIKNKSEIPLKKRLIVCEAMLDYLSLIHLFPTYAVHDAIILNSTINVDRIYKDCDQFGLATYRFPDYSEVVLLLDRDSSGDTASQKLMTYTNKGATPKIRDERNFFAPYKDINDFLIAKGGAHDKFKT